MANVLKHRFASGKTDGPDATQVQPSNWNDGHLFSGGVNGDVLTRDTTDASFGAKWATPVATPWIPIPYYVGQFFADGAVNVTTGINVHRYRHIGNNAIAYQFTGNMTFSAATGSIYIVTPFTLDDLNQILPVTPRGPFDFFLVNAYNATLLTFKRCDNGSLSIGTYYMVWGGILGIV
jgi:hypothetical protein